MNDGIVLVELFSWIGGFAKGLIDSGIVIKEHYFSEIDKHAIANYKYNFPDAKYIGSVKDVRGLEIKPDIITFGWPCQDNSIAGKLKGQRNGTRSGLLFEAGRILLEFKPRYFIAENVRGLYSVNKGIDFYESIRFLSYLGTGSPQYTVEMQLFNTDWFLPQNRERVYFVGHIGNRCVKRIFPFGENMQEVNEQQRQTTNTITTRYYESQAGGGYIIEDKQLLLNSATVCGYEIAENGDGVKFAYPESTTRRGRVGKKKSHTLDTMGNSGVFLNGFLRRYTEIECERLQGFPDNWTMYGNYDSEIKKIPRRQRYKMIGNAVTTNCIKSISENLLK